MNLSSYRDLFIGTKTPILTINGYVPRVYFNNTATALVAKTVKNKWLSLLQYYSYNTEDNTLSDKITAEYNNVANIVLDYVGGDKSKDTVLYTKSATEGANILANVFYQQDPNQIILATRMNHVASYLPFKEKMQVVLVNVKKDGSVDMMDYERKLKQYRGKIKNVIITGASNVTGIISPYYDMASMAHKYGAKITLDVVQLIQHEPFSMKPYNSPEHIDFIFFSSHKIYTGQSGGSVVGPADFFNRYLPLLFGNEVYNFLDDEQVIFTDVPKKYEAGYPDLLGIICMGEALKFISNIGIENVANYEKSLYEYIISKLRKIKGLTIYALDNPDIGAPIVSFNFNKMSYKTLSNILGYEYGIEVAKGTSGADIYVQSLLGLTNKQAYDLYEDGTGYGVVRVSMGLYNTFEDIDKFICVMENISNSL